MPGWTSNNMRKYLAGKDVYKTNVLGPSYTFVFLRSNSGYTIVCSFYNCALRFAQYIAL